MNKEPETYAIIYTERSESSAASRREFYGTEAEWKRHKRNREEAGFTLNVVASAPSLPK